MQTARDCVGKQVVTPLVDISLIVYRILPTVHFLKVNLYIEDEK